MSHSMPSVKIRKSDYQRLQILAGHTAEGMLESASLLHEELLRAKVVSDREAGTAQIGTTVRYRDHSDDSVHIAKLSYPKDALFESGTISVLSPIGAALIGLAPGAALEWYAGDGRKRGVTVLSVDLSSESPAVLRAEVVS